jgi:putative transposase
MARIMSLKPGARVFCGTVEFEIVAASTLSSVSVKNVINGEIRVLPIAELQSHSSEAPPESYTPLDCLTEEEQEFALKQFEKVKPAILKRMSRREMEELAAKHGVHYTTIYRMRRKYSETMSPAALVSRIKNRGGKGKPRIDKAVDDVIRNHFQEILDAKQVDITKLCVKSIQREIKVKCIRLGLKPPVWRTIDDRLDGFIQEKKLDARRKKKGGRSRTMAGGSFPDANWPLDVVQIDHTPLDIIIVDNERREPIGKAFLSIAICVFSRMVVGFSLSLDSPSIYSVGRLIAHCILPKREFLDQVGVDAEWDVYGMMGAILLDNASEFRAESFVPFQEEYLVDIRWRPVATPEYGGHIERLAKTLNDLIHQEPGSTMGNVAKREGYDSEGHACYTIDEIEKWLTVLITKIYHVGEHSALRTHDGIKMSPLEKYRIGILGDDKTPGIGAPDIVEDPTRLRLFLLPSEHRTVQRQGIELDKIHYYHDILRNLYGQKGEDGKVKKFLIKRDHRRISPIYIFDPDKKEYFAIPYRDLTRPPISYWELEASKKRCKEKGIDDPTEQQIFAAYAELRQIRDESVAKTQKARREKEAEKRRKNVSPACPERPQDSEDAANQPDAVESEALDVSSFYDDESLMDGVVVKKTSREG